MEGRRRNKYVLVIDIELTHPLSNEIAEAAAELAAKDIGAWLKSEGWGYGVARVESVYAPSSQFAEADFEQV